MKSYLNILLIFTFIFSCGYSGYKGELPKLMNPDIPPEQLLHDNNISVEEKFLFEIDTPPQLPVNPEVFPYVHGVTIISKQVYIDYKNNINKLAKSLESLKEAIENNPDDIQTLSAKTNIIHLKILNFQKKYEPKSEKNYISYKKIIEFDKAITDVNKYNVQANKYNGFLKTSSANNESHLTIKKENNDKLISDINSIIKIIKENPYKINSY